MSAPVLLVLPVMLVAAVLITISTIQGRAAVERLASQQLTQIHDQIRQHVEALVSLPTRVVQASIALIENGRLDPAEPRDWELVLIERFRAFQDLSTITWGGEDGQCVWVARYFGDDEYLYFGIKDRETGDDAVEYHVDLTGRRAVEATRSFVFDPRIRPWFLAPKQSGLPAWCEPYLWAVGSGEKQVTLGIAYGWPWFDATGEFGGVTSADLSFQDISRFLSGLRIGHTGRAYLVDADGLMLASSTAAALADDNGKRLRASASDEVWIQASAQHLATAFGSPGSVDRDYEEIIEIDGVREWLRATPFTHDTGLNWVIVTLVPETDFTAEIAVGRRRSAWFIAGVTLATLGLGVLLAMRLVRPIIELSTHVRYLGEGDLGRKINLPYARELVCLSDDINQMTADLRDRMEMRRSLAMAMDVQQSLLPSEAPHINGLDIAGHSTYCDETGGDYYDYLDIADLSNSSAALVVGDVVGHGIAAAMLMATARGILRSRCTESGSLGELLGHLNQLLVEVTSGSRFMTMLLVTIDGERGMLRLSSAGHDPPFIYDPHEDTFIELEGGGLPLGIMQGEQYPEATCGPLPLGSIILASTDGVWEARNEAEEMFGKERVREILRKNAHRSANDIACALRDGVQAFCGEAKQLDDITFVVARRR